jgi:hypothetical protein
MSMWTTVGSYLGKQVLFMRLPKQENFSGCGQIKNYVILAILECDFTSSNFVKALLKEMIAEQPLAIALFGRDSGLAFDSLLRLLGEEDGKNHIMTYHLPESDLDGAIEDFLQTTWPSEDRHSEWESYGIILLGQSDGTKVETAIRRRCDPPHDD